MKMNDQNGFTLIELLIVMAIIAILGAIAILSMADYRSRAIESTMQTDIKNLSTAMEALFQDCYGYTSTLSGTTTGPGIAFLTGTGSCSSQQNISVSSGNSMHVLGSDATTYVIAVSNNSGRNNRRCIAMRNTGSFAWGADCPAAQAAIP